MIGTNLMTQVIKFIPKTLSQHAFNAGFKGFYTQEPEVCQIENFTDIQQKEYMRGWWAAYEKSHSESIKKFHL